MITSNNVSRGSSVDIDIDKDRKCVVVWEREENGYSKIYAQRYQEDKIPLGNNYRVSMISDTLEQTSPSVAVYKGKIFTAWNQRDNTHYKIMANITEFDSPSTQIKSQYNNNPKNFQLHYNYPNPFNSITTIKYQVSRETHVSLIIFNLMGEEIIKLEEKEVMPGIHKVHWNAKNSQGGDVPSGMYLYRLTVDVNTQTRKMVLVRREKSKLFNRREL